MAFRGIVLAGACALSVSACATVEQAAGTVPDPVQIATVQKVAYEPSPATPEEDAVDDAATAAEDQAGRAKPVELFWFLGGR